MLVYSALTLAARAAKRPLTTADAWIIGTVVVVMVGVLVSVLVVERRRRAKIIETLAALGFAVNSKPDPDDKARAYRSLAGLVDWPRGPKGVQWESRGRVRDQDVAVFEHMYTTGAGKSRQVHRNVVAAVSCPTAYPSVTIVERHLGDKIMSLFGKKDLALESEAFNKRWKIRGDSEEFTLLVASPPVQEWCMKLPPRCWIRLGRGALCVGMKKTVNADQVRALAACPLDLQAMLPPELAAWSPAMAAG